MLTVWPRAGTPPAENTMLNDDDEDDEDHKSFAELVEENAFAIETFLYLLFLVLFTSYAVLAHGSSFFCLCMRVRTWPSTPTSESLETPHTPHTPQATATTHMPWESK